MTSDSPKFLILLKTEPQRATKPNWNDRKYSTKISTEASIKRAFKVPRISVAAERYKIW